ncbi:FAD-binding oxidoreductase [Alphaproteobacteria bacterium]|nr:FAD-binding oxidoreductase [Alphaproteobacteria bacterium]
MADGSIPFQLDDLKNMIEGDFLDNQFDRGRYATDASIYQMMPHAVVLPKSELDIENIISFCRKTGTAILPRGGGTSQCGQTVNHAIVVDNTKYLNQLISVDLDTNSCVVEPGIVLDDLNRQLKPYGLWFAVDVSTSSRATIGGMTANNSCGGRSIRYGIMRDNVLSIDAILLDGTKVTFGAEENSMMPEAMRTQLLAMGHNNSNLIDERFPKVLRRVGGYNLDALVPDAMSERPGGKSGDGINFAHLLLGSEGTLCYFTSITLKLMPLPAQKLMGICHFPSFYKAMDATQHLVKLDPVAVELIDDTMLSLASSISMFQPIIKEVVVGEPKALLIVEFAEDDSDENLRRLDKLEKMMEELGFGWDKSGEWQGGVVRSEDLHQQARVSEMRKSGLNIMMSMKQEAKPVSFVEDCAVDLEHLAEYTDKLAKIFEKYNTVGTWYAHASVGCLHVRPVLSMKKTNDIEAMRAIAEEAFALVRQYGGSHSGEHGDGILRSEFNETMFGSEMVALFSEVKRLFDPAAIFNPGKIIDAPKMDDRSLFRFAPGYEANDFPMAFDWSAWPGKSGGLQGAIEMCNNNGACRKLQGGVMCPSYRVTREEKDSTRGRANSLRLALSGQLGEDALISDEMQETLKYCVSCKACKRECPTGVDMAKMKLEVTSLRAAAKGVSFKDKLIAYLPDYAPIASKLSFIMNLRNNWYPIAYITEKITGFTAKRDLPVWRADYFRDNEVSQKRDDKKDTDKKMPVILFVDTFNRYFEPEIIRAASRVLDAAGYHVFIPRASNDKPVCCGRTFLSAGMIDQAKKKAEMLVSTLAPFAEQQIPIVGLEPSCLLALRDEVVSLLSSKQAEQVAKMAVTFEELLAKDKPALPLVKKAKAYLHGHCHQKAFDVVQPIEDVLAMVEGLEVEKIETSCCGMAGAFGYDASTYDVSMRMAEENLLPKIRETEPSDLIVADGTSCRCQIEHGTSRKAMHVAQLLDQSLAR